MFFRLKNSGMRSYVQIVENERIEGAVARPRELEPGHHPPVTEDADLGRNPFGGARVVARHHHDPNPRRLDRPHRFRRRRSHGVGERH